MKKMDNFPKEFSKVINAWDCPNTNISATSQTYIRTAQSTVYTVIGSPPQGATNTSKITQSISINNLERKKSIDIDDLVSMFEKTAEDKAQMADARKWFEGTLTDEDKGTLKSLRLKAGLSQKELAEKIGLKQSNISIIESGNRNPETKTIEKLANTLQVSIEEILKAIKRSQRC